METIDELRLDGKIRMSVSQTNQKPVADTGWFTRQAMAFEKSRYGWMAMMLTFQSCLGSIACMYILYSNASIFMLSACAAITMGSNALFIALAPPKVCLGGFYFSVGLNTLFLLINLPY